LDCNEALAACKNLPTGVLEGSGDEDSLWTSGGRCRAMQDAAEVVIVA
jgi:hypothetical protein